MLQKRFSREIVFRIVAFCIPFAFLLLREITLRLLNYGGDLDLFISAGGDFSQYKALEFGPRDPQVLYNLCVSYISNRQYDSAQSTLSKLESISPGFSGTEEVRRHLEQSHLRK